MPRAIVIQVNTLDKMQIVLMLGDTRVLSGIRIFEQQFEVQP